jgi:ABC-type spermidine/putrescine transport system, permease component I
MLLLFVLPILEILRIVLSSSTEFPGLIKHFATSPLYRSVFLNTLLIASEVTIGTLVVAYPIAFITAHTSKRVEKVLLGVTVASMWMSVLIRSYAWTVLLQANGPIGSMLYRVGVTAEPVSLLFTRTAVVVAMTHVLSPYMIFSVWSTTVARSRKQLLIAEAFGATRFLYFLRVFVPESFRGVIAGCALVFIFSLGFLITPELLGGGGGKTMMIGVLIDQQINELGNWTQGALLSSMLLIIVGALLLVLWTILSKARGVFLGEG